MKNLKKKLIYLLFFLSIGNQLLFAGEKEKIIKKINETHSIKFNFNQKTNKHVEEGFCILLFPKKLKCIYNNNNKDLILNNNKLAIIQKRYNKIYFYPTSRSFFYNILDKNELVKIIDISKLNIFNDEIHLISNDTNKNKITILFKKTNYDLLGWKIEDQFKNNILFSIDIISTNEVINSDIFKIPKLN